MESIGRWSVSVAESLHHGSAYSLYVKSIYLSFSLVLCSLFTAPTHHLTLTRSAMEILELDATLSEHANVPVLPLPALPVTPPKRKSTFLHTLSRLSARKSTAVSPKAEINDPLASSPSATSTGLAAYFTAIANSPVLRHTRAWKRFVRVRPDDLESVRPEKAIKRVRSDLAAHLHDVHPPLQDTVAPEDSLPTPVQSPKDLDHTLSDPISRHEVKKSQGDCPRQLFASPILNVLYRLHSASYST